jgi:HECT-like Ubiquitin-conjugating enzyme (E2)-binding
MKVFYNEIDDPLKLLDEYQSTLEELALPKQELEELKQTLVGSAQILPQSARTFQDWQVGLLDRYEERPSGQGAMDHNALNHKAPENLELFKLPEGWSELYV